MTAARPNEPNFSRSGVYGDTRLASKEKSELLVLAMLNDLLVSLS
jgi:creatinine amidohydrolase/Fe(II)-dependent formamide hydrolase-like protein